MTVRYRITTWRFDIKSCTYSEPTFEGATVEECDNKALAHFDTESTKPANAWEGMRIVRVDSPAVAEVTTLLKSNGRQQGHDDYSL